MAQNDYLTIDDVENIKIKQNHYIYKITNKLNNKFYIGKRSCNCDIINDKYMGSGILIKKAIKTYGIDNFKKEILVICESAEYALNVEALLVNDELLSNPLCYNLNTGGWGGKSKIIPARTKEFKDNVGNFWRGKPKSDEQKQKTRESLLGKTHSDERKKNQSESHKGINFKQSVVNCPHCNKSGGKALMKRYHFDNCKSKGVCYASD